MAQVTMNEFVGFGFTMAVPDGWILSATASHRGIFVGPKIGPAPVTVAVVAGAADGAVGAWMRELTRAQLAKREQFSVLSNDAVDFDGGNGWTRYGHWYDVSRNIVFFERVVAVDVDGVRWIIVAVQPNHSGHQHFDRVFREMIRSFRLTGPRRAAA